MNRISDYCRFFIIVVIVVVVVVVINNVVVIIIIKLLYANSFIAKANQKTSSGLFVTFRPISSAIVSCFSLKSSFMLSTYFLLDLPLPFFYLP